MRNYFVLLTLVVAALLVLPLAVAEEVQPTKSKSPPDGRTVTIRKASDVPGYQKPENAERRQIQVRTAKDYLRKHPEMAAAAKASPVRKVDPASEPFVVTPVKRTQPIKPIKAVKPIKVTKTVEKPLVKNEEEAQIKTKTTLPLQGSRKEEKSFFQELIEKYFPPQNDKAE